MRLTSNNDYDDDNDDDSSFVCRKFASRIKKTHKHLNAWKESERQRNAKRMCE